MSPIERLQYDVAATLTADPFFATVPIFIMRPRIVMDPADPEGRTVGASITSMELEEASHGALTGLIMKGTKWGAVLKVMMPECDCERPGMVGPALRGVISVLCEEIPLANMDPTNGTLLSAESLAIFVSRLLNHRVFAPLGALAAEKDVLKPSVDVEQGKITYEVRYGCDLNNTPLGKAKSVVIANASGTITLTSATAGASIYYSTDDSMPSHGGTIGGAGASGSTLYTVPFSAPSGTGVRAAAYKTGLAGSDASYLLVP